MKIVLIPVFDHYRDWIGKTYYDIITHFHKNSKHEIHLFWSDWRGVENIIKRIDPDLFVLFCTETIGFAKHFEYIFNMRGKVFACCLDIFHINRVRNCKYIKKCDGILHFSKQRRLLSSYKKIFPNKFIGCFRGRFVNTKKYKDYGYEKEYDILIYGSRGGKTPMGDHASDVQYKEKWEKHNKRDIPKEFSFYPLREKLEKLLSSLTKYRIKILPNKCIFNAHVANSDLSKLINKSYLTMATGGRPDIAFSKYFEIGASYSGILGNIPEDYRDLFENNIVEVTEWMSDKEILDIIDGALADKKKLFEMTQRMGRRIHGEYDLKACVKDMDHVFDKIFKKD